MARVALGTGEPRERPWPAIAPESFHRLRSNTFEVCVLFERAHSLEPAHIHSTALACCTQCTSCEAIVCARTTLASPKRSKKPIRGFRKIVVSWSLTRSTSKAHHGSRCPHQGDLCRGKHHLHLGYEAAPTAASARTSTTSMGHRQAPAMGSVQTQQTKLNPPGAPE